MKKERIFAIIFGVIGIGVIGLWIMLIGTKQVPEFDYEPIAIVVHIIIETIMALLALLSAVLLWKNRSFRYRVVLVTCGMILYSSINASGYYAELGDVAMLIMFGCIIVFILYVMWYVCSVFPGPQSSKED